MTVKTYTPTFDDYLAKVQTKAELIDIIKTIPYAEFWLDLSVNDTFINFAPSELKIPEYEYHKSLAGALMLSRSATNFVEGLLLNPKVALTTKKKQYIAQVQMFCKEEAAIFNACITKDLASVYPILTHEFICEALNDHASICEAPNESK